MGDGQTSRLYRKLRTQFREQGQASDSPCWICRMPIDYSIPRTDPHTNAVNDEAWELDHLYPRSTHPHFAEDSANFRHSHAGCNRKRSNRMPDGPIEKPSRKWLK